MLSGRNFFRGRSIMAAGTELENGRVVLWWLRSPGNNQNNASNVNTDGALNPNGNNVNNDNNAVRPALLQ